MRLPPLFPPSFLLASQSTSNQFWQGLSQLSGHFHYFMRL
jgi:hypothetical protein